MLRGTSEGIAQACHGKAAPLKRMKQGDGVIYYSSKMEFGRSVPCQCFTAIGQVLDDNVYSFDMGNGFVPFRRNVNFFKCHETSIIPIIPELSFITNKQKWGGVFRFGMLEIPKQDFLLILSKMNPEMAKDSELF